MTWRELLGHACRVYRALHDVLLVPPTLNDFREWFYGGQR